MNLNKLLIPIAVFSFVMYAQQGIAQSSSDCEGAIPICQDQVTVGPNTFNNTGAINDENNASCWSGTGAAGSVWYSFSPQTAGPLGFELMPTGGTDYDFALFDITNGCANMQELSCNFSLEFGATGMDNDQSDWADDNFMYPNCSCNCPNSNNEDCNPWNDAVNVNPNNTYVLMINYYSGSNDGFTFDFQFEPGLVSINDDTPPEVTMVATPNCGDNTLTITFSEPVLCSSIQNGDFTITGPGGPFTVTNVDLSGCNSSGFVTEVVVTLDNPVQAGNYNLNTVNVEDMCGNVLIAPGHDEPFVVPATLNPIISGILDICSGETTVLTGSPSGTGFTYSWAPGGQTTPSINVNAGGTYTLTMTSPCATNSTSVVVSETPVTTITPTITGPTEACDNGQTVDISASPSGLNYTWNTGQTNGTINVGPGTYTVTVNPTVPSCEQGTSSSFTINSVTCLPPDFCYNGTDLIATGGDGTYTWSQNTGFFGTWQNIGTGSPLSSGALNDPNTDIQVTTGDGQSITYPDLASVPLCTSSLTACIELNGDITVSNGDGNYTWDEWTTTSVVSNDCVTCGGTPFFGNCLGATVPCTITSTGWVNFASGTTVTPTGNYPILISDGSGATLTINDPNALAPCATSCIPPNLVVDNLTACDPNTVDLNNAINASSDPGNASFHSSQLDADSDANPISNMVGVSGTYYIRYEDPSDPNCFTTAVVTVTINPAYNLSENVNACENSTVVYPDGSNATIIANTSYTSNLFTAAGCDSIIVTNVTMDPEYNLTENINACENSTVVYPDGTNATITGNTSYTSNLTTSAGCDSIIVTNVTMDPISNSTENLTLCLGANHTYPDGTTSTNIVANESHVSVLTGANGCDSTITTNLTINATINVNENINVCSGGNHMYPDGTVSNNIIANESHVSTLISIQGCDSIITTTVNVDPVYNITQNINACENSSVTYPDGTTATITGNTSYTSNLTTSAGCDSIIVTNVTMDPVYASTDNITVCTGANYTYPDGTTSTNITVNESHVSNLTSTAGCDSVVTTNISVNSAFATNENFNICSGTNYTYPDGTASTNITVNESHVSTFVSMMGCDSLVTTNLTVDPIYNITENINVCENSTVTYPDGTNATITASTSYTSNLTTVAGCDSIVFTNVTMNQVYNITQNINACENSSVTYPDGTNAIITASTSYTSNLTSSAGCDSIIVTNVTMDPVYASTDNITVCTGANYTYPDGTTSTNITVNETHVSNLTSTAGCDSVITTNLSVNSAFATNENFNICSGTNYTYPDGTTSTNITVNESHISTFVSMMGCDSLVTTNLTIDPIYNITENINVCENSTVTYPDGTNATITASTSYTSNLTTVAGCDSIVFTNVTMNQVYNITQNINACENSSVTYPDGTNAIITASTSYTSNLTSSAGCDSIIVTNVTMDPVYASTDNITVCTGANYTYPDGTTSTNITVNETHVSNLTSTAGCDSVITTNLSVNSAFATNENFNICSGTNYTYPDGTASTNITVNESHVSTFVSVMGCDSLVTTNLTVDPIYNITENINVCENSTVTYPDGTNATITASTSYTSNLTTVAGCDSIVFTNVTMNPIYNITQNINACENSSVTYPDGTNAIITANTSYTSNLTSSAGCDSIIVTNVTMDPIYALTENVTVCSGANYTYPDGTTSTNILVDQTHLSNFTTTTGCDSTITTVLTVNQGPNVVAGPDQTICEGESITLTATGAQSFVWTNGITNGVPFVPTVPTMTYIVSGTDANGCTSSDQVTVTINQAPQVQFLADRLSGCIPHTVTFTNLTSPSGTNCEWDFGDGTTAIGCDSVTHTYTSAGTFNVGLTVTSSAGCTGNAYYTEYITVSDPPVASISADAYVLDLDDTEVQFYNNSTGGDSYEWTFGDGMTSFEEEPSHAYPEVGNAAYEITMVVSNQLGCQDIATLTITVNDILIFYIPNVFTPNGDQFNNSFQPVFTSGYDPYDFHLMIFDRWGEIIFESYDASKGWDGTFGAGGIVQDGVYVWKIDFKETMSDKRHELSGHVTVLK